jgi:YidC/Oxa1 family membrane protein insertase
VNILYTIIIFPLEKIFEISFMTFRRIFDSGWALIGISGTITLLTLPLYLVADKWQKIERETAKRLKAKVSKIKAVFSGDEQFLLLSTYYRQNHYHPVYALRSSLGLMVQIPFFIAAYHYLSHSPFISGKSFFWISDLGKSDSFFPGFPHILPLLMTLFNVLSAYVYTRGLPLREKAQLYIAAAVFLVLLYNSPSALVLYWTMNNVFSLLKNIIQKCARPPRILYIMLCVLVTALDIYILGFFSSGYVVKRILLAAAVSTVFLLPLLKRLAGKFKLFLAAGAKAAVRDKKCCVFSAVIIFLFASLALPSSLIASSVQEFSFLGAQDSPLPYLFQTLLQGFGFFIFWPLVIYCLFSKNSKNIKAYITAGLTILGGVFLVNSYLFPGDYGFLTISLGFSNAVFPVTAFSFLLQAGALVLVCALLVFLLFRAKKKYLLALQGILIISLLLLSSVNTVKIVRGYLEFQASSPRSGATDYEPVFTLSSSPENKNVVIIMLDRAISGYAGEIFREYPEIEKEFSGFVFYPNCVSFGPVTLFGTPPIFGGYEYTPEALSVDNGKALVERHNEALLMMPRLFSEHNYRVTVTDPSWANYNWIPDLSIYEPYPAVKSENIIGRYSSSWIRRHPRTRVFDAPAFLKRNLILFSFFKAAPPFLRFFVYDDGKWLSNIVDSVENGMPVVTLDEFAALDTLPLITKIENAPFDSFSIIVNQLTHESALVDTLVSIKEGPLSSSPDYQVNVAALMLLAKFFDKLKSGGSWDNTRIIVAADHGWKLGNLPLDFSLPSGDPMAAFNPLLMVKDFNASGPLVQNDEFMTQADTPAMAVSGLFDNPKNPFSGKPITDEKQNGVTITTNDSWSPDHHNKTHFKIEDNQWLFVHDSIFKKENWSLVKPVKPKQ